jgi:chromosome segregation ATPase
LKDNGIYRTN